MKSFNDIWIKSNSFCHLREHSNESPFQGAPLRDHGNYFLATLTPSTIFLSVELLPTKSTPRRLFFHPSRCVSCLSSRDVSMSHSMSDPELLDLREDGSFWSFPFPL